MKKGIIIAASLLMLTAGTAGFVYWNYHNAVSYHGAVNLPVPAAVTIIRGASGMPVISSTSYPDALFALGYCHAQDRLHQINEYRAMALGITDSDHASAVLINRLARLIGFKARAKAIVEKLGPHYREYLKSYTGGINAYQNQKAAREYMSRDMHDDWQPADTIAILLMFEWTEAFLNNRELLLPLPQTISRLPFRDLIPAHLWYVYADEDRDNVLVLRELRKILFREIGHFLHGTAFYISGSDLKEGAYALCYNLESGMERFPGYYPASIRSDKTVSGITIAGMPFFLFGKNRSLSFAGMSAAIDTQIFFREKTIDANDESLYFDQGTWKKFQTIEEVAPDGRKEIFRYTIHGPVISDLFLDQHKPDIITVRSPLPDDSLVRMLFDIPVAGTIYQALEKMRGVTASPRVYLFASADGMIQAYAGLALSDTNKKILNDGGLSGARWEERDISGPFTINKNRPFASGTIIPHELPSWQSELCIHRDKGLSLRIQKRLAEKDLYLRKDLEAIMVDTASPHAERFIPVFLPLLERIPITSSRLCRIYFHNWDLRLEPDSVAATLYETLLVALVRETVADKLGDQTDSFLEHYPLLLDNLLALLTANRSILFDDLSTKDRFETRDTIFDRALLKSMRALNKMNGPYMDRWRWGNIHKGRYVLPRPVRGSLVAQWFHTGMNAEAAMKGGNSTMYRGTIDPTDRLRCTSTTALSVIDCKGTMLVSPNFGMALNPRSVYFNPFIAKQKFVDSAEKGVEQKKMELVPFGQ